MSLSNVECIPLERPASLKRWLPSFDEQEWKATEYIVGNENEGLLYLFSDETIDHLGSISPIVLYGEKGLGKTALAITLAVRWSRHTGKRPLSLTSGSAFAKDYASAVEIDDLASFQARHRQAKLLLIDDLEPLTSKPAAQAELAVTLDDLASTDIPVLLTVSKLPSTLENIYPALASRLTEGYSLGLNKLEATSIRVAIEKLAAEIDNQLATAPLVDYCLATDQAYSIEDLRSLVTIAHQSKDEHGANDIAVLSKLMRQHLDGKSLSTATIAKAVARKMGIKLTDLRGSSRQAKIVRARGIAFLLSRKLTSLSLQQIGSFFGGRDHSTVLHACRKTADLVQSDAELSSVLSDVQADLLS